MVAICRHAWKVVHRLHPGLFIQGAQVGDTPVWNPWEGVAMKRRRKATKPAATRDEVYAFAWGAVVAGEAQAAAAAVICFEWLQRPENVLAGYVSWTGYRSNEHPNSIRIEHHKTGEMCCTRSRKPSQASACCSMKRPRISCRICRDSGLD